MASEMEDWVECQTGMSDCVCDSCGSSTCSNDLIKGLVESLPEVTVPEYLRYL